jgi:DNA-binding response OmpR family regulator
MERTPAKHRANISVVIADSRAYMSQALRNALVNEGYHDVQTFGRLGALRDAMKASLADLLVLDVDLPGGDSLALVRDIRHSRVGRNPFLPVILLTWASDPDVVERAVGSGVDLILVKPLSAAQLFSRIDGLVADRKPFVVTADYVGPDRRGHPKQPQAKLFSVPNTLKDKMEGKQVDPAELSDQINAALQDMNASRLAQAGAKLSALIEDMCGILESGKSLDSTEYELAQIGRIARSIAILGGDDIGKLCGSLMMIVNTMRSDPAAVDARQIELLRPLSHSILCAANPRLMPSPVMDEITRTVSSFVPDGRPDGSDREPTTAV